MAASEGPHGDGRHVAPFVLVHNFSRMLRVPDIVVAILLINVFFPEFAHRLGTLIITMLDTLQQGMDILQISLAMN